MSKLGLYLKLAWNLLRPAPEHFKAYTTGERKVAYTKAQRTPTNGSNGVYDGPAVVKEIELAELGEDSKPVFIAQDLTPVEEEALKMLLKEFRDIFAWTYHDMKGVPPSVVQHTIPIISNAKPVQQRPYPMNPKYAKIVQEELEKLIKMWVYIPYWARRMGFPNSCRAKKECETQSVRRPQKG